MFTNLVPNLFSKRQFTKLAHIFIHNFCSQLLLTVFQNFSSQLLFKTLVCNSCSKILFTTLVHDFCSQLPSHNDNIHNICSQILLTTFFTKLLFQNIALNFCSKVLFTTLDHNFFSKQAGAELGQAQLKLGLGFTSTNFI